MYILLLQLEVDDNREFFLKDGITTVLNPNYQREFASVIVNATTSSLFPAKDAQPNIFGQNLFLEELGFNPNSILVI